MFPSPVAASLYNFKIIMTEFVNLYTIKPTYKKKFDRLSLVIRAPDYNTRGRGFESRKSWVLYVF